MSKRTQIDLVSVKLVKQGAVPYRRKRICNARGLAELGLKFLKNADREMFLLVCLNGKKAINCIHLLNTGTLDQVYIYPREVIKTALLSNSSSIAFIHNHVDGDPRPSLEDIRITKNLKRYAELFGIAVLDHVIVTSNGRFASLKRRDVL